MEHPPPRRHFRLPCSDTDTLITADRNIFTRIINNCLSRASRLLLGAVAGRRLGAAAVRRTQVATSLDNCELSCNNTEACTAFSFG